MSDEGGDRRSAGRCDGWRREALAGRRGRRRSHALDGAEVVEVQRLPFLESHHKIPRRAVIESTNNNYVPWLLAAPDLHKSHSQPFILWWATRATSTWQCRRPVFIFYNARTVEPLDNILEALPYNSPYREFLQGRQMAAIPGTGNLVDGTVQPLSNRLYVWVD